jgi:putative ABC transport system permease protein
VTRQVKSVGARVSRVIYRSLLALYPQEFRRRFGWRMLDDFERMYEECQAAGKPWGVMRLLGRMVLDTARAAPGQHRDARSRKRGWSGNVNERGKENGMGGLILDIRTAVRGLTRRPGYSVVAVATLTLAIGANTVLFSVLDGVLLRPLPYPEADRLAMMSESSDQFYGSVSYPNFLDWREQARSFEEMGVISWATVTLTGGTEPVRIAMGRADPAFMRVAGLEPILGRAFLDEENVDGPRPVAILSHALWQQSFGADDEVIGQTVSLNGTPAEVVGVLAQGADFAESGVAVWVPVVPSIGDWADRREVHALTVLGRLAPDATMESATLELGRLGESLALEYPDANSGKGGHVMPLSDVLLGDVSTSVWLLMGMVTLVLLIACANVASLLLVRLTARRQELSLRRALGARQWDVTRLLLTESLGLTLTGGALGVALAYLAINPAVRLLQGRLPRVEEVSLDTTVLAFAFTLSLIPGLAFGLLPGMGGRGRGADPRPGTGRSQRGAGRAAAMARSTLSAAQVAGSVVLLVGAGLLMRSFSGLQSVDVGFDPNNLATMAISLSGSGRDAEEVIQFYRGLPELIESVPGVSSAAAINALPISGGDSSGDVTIDGRPFETGENPTASFRRATPGYFETVGTPVLYGRTFVDSDVGEPMTTVINEAMAGALWPDPSQAVGARIKVGSPEYEPWLTVIGVVGDMRNVGVDSEPRFATYEPHAQRPWSTMSLVFRTDRDPSLLTGVIRQRVMDAGGSIPVYDFSTLNERIADSLRPRQVAMVLTAAFALLALITASIGVYGVLSYSVSQRAPELGVRLALGAGSGRVMRAVAGQAIRMISAGLAVGLIAAGALGSVLGSVLHNVSPYDPLTYITVPIILALVGALACYVPARRAAHIDPATSLRKDG